MLFKLKFSFREPLILFIFQRSNLFSPFWRQLVYNNTSEMICQAFFWIFLKNIFDIIFRRFKSAHVLSAFIIYHCVPEKSMYILDILFFLLELFWVKCTLMPIIGLVSLVFPGKTPLFHPGNLKSKTKTRVTWYIIVYFYCIGIFVPIQ